MKNTLIISAILLWNILPTGLFGQTISNIVSDTVACCPQDSANIDIDSDGIDDFKIQLTWYLDTARFDAIPFQNNLLMTYPQDSGTVFINFYEQSLLARAPRNCRWSTHWLPYTGERYIGFFRANEPADTTFGWIKMDFRGVPGFCSDTIIVFEAAYNSTANVHLNAGQRLYSTSIKSSPANFDVIIHPNPCGEKIFLNFNEYLTTAPVLNIYTILGKRVTTIRALSDNYELNVTDLSVGTYFLEISGEKIYTGKFIKQ